MLMHRGNGAQKGPILTLIGHFLYYREPTKAEVQHIVSKLERLHATRVITLEPFDLDSDKPFTLTFRLELPPI